MFKESINNPFFPLPKKEENLFDEEQSTFAGDTTILLAEDDDTNYKLLCKML